MNTLETRTLLGYSIDTFEIEEFKEYYDENKDKFNDFSRSAFLKAISIPPSYFLEQPEETQEELLCNKLDLVGVQKKYAGLSIMVVYQGDEILNATKIKTNEVETRFEAIASIEDVKGMVWSRPMIKDGYYCGYSICNTVSKGGYNRALFIDLPILFNKPVIIHEGFIELANPNMDVEKDMIYYTNSSVVDFFKYQHIALAIEDAIENILEIDDINKEENTNILRETPDVACRMVDDKIIPRSLMFPLIKFLDKKEEEGYGLTTRTLLQAVIAFDLNVKTLKLVNAIRGSKEYIYGLPEAMPATEMDDEL